jgi:hypothetical protein
MAKRSKKEKPALIYFILAAAILTILQAVLIIFGIISNVSDYFSVGTLFFNLIRLAIVIFAGIYFFKDNLIKCLFNGAIIGFVSSLILVVFAYASKQYFNVPILGISVNNTYYLVLMLFLILENTILYGFLVFLTSWITRKIRKF